MLRNRAVQIIIVLGLIGVIVVAALALAFLRPPQEASVDTQDPTEEVAEVTEETEGDEKPTPVPGVAIFEIVPAESQARFTLGEILRGENNTVVGSTDQVAGQISINFNDPPASRVGTLLINARTFSTDAELRDRAIKNRVLETNTYEFIAFTPTSISGWPGAAIVGETFVLHITGDLTLLDVTLPVTFTVTIISASETRLEGSGSTTIAYADYGITIPDVPAVASVDDDVLLEIDFVAVVVE